MAHSTKILAMAHPVAPPPPCVRRTISDGSEVECIGTSPDIKIGGTVEFIDEVYDGAVPCRQLYTRTASLKSIRFGALNQCCCRKSGVMSANLDEENTGHVAAFITD